MTAYLDGPLTLTKCLEFERLLLEYSQRYNIEIRYTNQISNNLKYEIRARFELTDSQFYDLNQQQLSVYLSEMIAPVTKVEFLKVLKKTVTFIMYQRSRTSRPSCNSYWSIRISFTGQ